MDLEYLTKTKQDRSIMLMLEGYSRTALNKTAQNIFAAEINNDQHPDLHTLRPIETSKQISIEQVRILQQRLTRKPSIHTRHLVIIDLVEMLSISAANSLLKVLEEPAGICFSILLTQSMDRVLPTITSRCFKVKLPVVKQTKDLLAYLLEMYPDYQLTPQQCEQWYQGIYSDVLPFSPKEQLDVILIMLSFYAKDNSDPRLFNIYEKVLSYKRSTVQCIGLDEAMVASEAQYLWSSIRRNNV